MKLSFDERPYSGSTFRPRPEIHFDPQTNLLIVATPWGPRAGARKAIDRMLNYLMLAQGDKEVTSPFERLSCLSVAANNLRTSALLANEAIYRDENKTEYKVGVEIFAAYFQGNEGVWVQAGHPHILLSRTDNSVTPLGCPTDLSFDLSSKENLLAPLPSLLLGLDSTVNLTIGSFRAQVGDKIVLLSHSQPPRQIFSFESSQVKLDTLSKSIAQQAPDLAFWLGILELRAS